MSGPERARDREGEEKLERENQRLREENERLRQKIEQLQEQLEKALRAVKRQAAPHSRGEPKKNPKQPGRKPGADYGRQACRPRRIDARIGVPLPEQCPHCGAAVALERTEAQYQEEIVRRTLVRRFDIAVGHCQRCGRHVQGRHPWQTSHAVGAAAVQLGPQALTLAALLNKQMGAGPHHAGAATRLWADGEPLGHLPGLGPGGRQGGAQLSRTDRGGAAEPGEHLG